MAAMKKLFLTLVLAGVSLQSPIMASVTNTDISAQAKQAEQLLWAGNLRDANKLYKSILKGAGELGDSVQAASIYDNYAWLLQGLGKYDDAAQYANKALDMRKRVLPPNAPEIADSYEHIGEQFEVQSQYRQAVDAYKQAQAIRAQGGEAQLVALSNVTERLAIMQMRLGDTTAAGKSFADALSEKAAIGAEFQPYANKLAAQTVMYRYALGSPNCSRQAVSGESLATIDAGGLVVQATVLPAQDFKGTTAFVRVINNGHGPVDFLPEPPLFLEIAPQFRIATKLESEKVATQIEKKGQRSANLIRFFQGDATTSVTSTMMTNAPRQPQWNWAMYPNGQWGAYPSWQRGGTQMTTVTTQVPDWEARARAEAKAQAATQKANAAAALIREQKLLATTVQPGQMVEGSVLFDSTSFKTAILRIPIGNAVFEFPIEK